MESRLYESKLHNHKMFKDLKDSLKDNPSGKLQNLIEFKDDVLYVWNSVENCLFSLNLKHLEEHDEETQYQKLHLVCPPPFAVERIASSACGGRLCAWGARGAAVVELPPRWGRGGLFDSGTKTVLCKSFNVEERFLYSACEVRRVHWHPSSLSHLLILVSDNTIRLYNIALKGGPKLVKIFTIGPKPTSQLAGRTILDSLGDTAVDFTPAPDSEALLILRGNGDVYMMNCELDSKSPLHPKLSGPLAMYPPAVDNYGSESCSITSLGGGSTPPLVIVATCSAALYHCLLLPNGSENEDECHALYVVEAVELNMVLGPEDADLHFSYPVHLYPCTSNLYACVHAGGVHAVSLSVMRHLKEYVRCDEVEIETVLSSLCSMQSVVQHLVCTSGVTDLSPPVGVALATPPLPKLIVLCADANICVRTLEPFDLEEQLYKEMQLKNPALEQEDINKILKEGQKLSFTSTIQEILTREVSQPILKITKSEEASAKECLELLTQATVTLRGQYVSRQQRALDAITRKLKALRTQAVQHQQWCTELEQELDDVRLQSVVLQEKCRLAEKYQDDMKYRCSAVIRSIRASSSTSPAERELLSSLERHRLCAEQFVEQIKLLKQHAQHKSSELEKWKEEYKKKDIALGKSHSDTISSILQRQTSQISELIEETKLLKDQLSIV